MKPAEGVCDSADVVVAVPLPSLDEGDVEHPARFRIQTPPDVGQAKAPLPHSLVELVVSGLGLTRDLAVDLDRSGKFTPPVVKEAEIPETGQIEVGITKRLAEKYRLLEHPDGLVQLTVCAMHASTGGQSFGQDPVVPDLTGDGRGFIRASPGHRLVLPSQRERVGEREVS